MERKPRVEITLDKFRCVKILLESGATYEEVTNMTNVSPANIARIRGADTFEEYKQIQRARAAAYTAKKHREKEEAEKLLQAEINKQEAVQRQEEEERQKEEERKRTAATCQASGAAGNFYQMNRLIELMKEQNEILKSLSNKVAFIVEELTMPAKTGGE